MTKYLIGVAVLLVAGWTAYRAFSNLHAKDEPSDLSETVDPPPVVEASSDEEAAAGPGVLPLFVGATWTYIVTDSRDTEGPRTFVLKVDRAPEAAVAGMSEAGFEGAMKPYPLTDADGAARIDGLFRQDARGPDPRVLFSAGTRRWGSNPRRRDLARTGALH